jgi:hypothetical protein
MTVPSESSIMVPMPLDATGAKFVSFACITHIGFGRDAVGGGELYRSCNLTVPFQMNGPYRLVFSPGSLVVTLQMA